MKRIKQFASSMLAVMLAGTLTMGSLSVSAFGAEDAGSVESTSVETSFEEATEEVETGESDAAVFNTSEVAVEDDVVTSYTVTLDANGGYFQNEWDDVLNETLEKTEILNKTIPVGGTVSTVPVYEQESTTGTFLGWSLVRDGEILLQEQEGYVPVENCVLYAVWQVEEIQEEDRETDEQESDQAENFSGNISAEENEDTFLADEDNEAVIQDQEQTDPDNGKQADRSIDIIEEEKEENIKTDASMGIVDSGKCGENLTWTLDGEGAITISGTGEMWDEGYWFTSLDMDSVTSIIVEQGVTRIGDGSFDRCSSLEKVVISSSVLSIGDYAFEECINLREVIIQEGVASIGNDAFSGCSSLENIEIPCSVLSIGDGAFANCDDIQNIVIPSSVSSIGDSGFYSCSSLSSVKILESKTGISFGDYLFSECNSLTDISIQSNVDKFGVLPFYECWNIANIHISQDIVDNFQEVFNWTNVVGGYTGESTKVSVTLSDDVTVITEGCFSKCRLIKIDIPNTVKSIGANAFSSCIYLEKVFMPDSVEVIGDGAFSGCKKIKDLKVSQNISSISDNTFKGCLSIESFDIPDKVQSIGKAAFQGCSNLTNVSLSDNIISIGDSAFCDCSNLTNVSLSDNIISIGDSAFSGCANLLSISIPRRVTEIGNSTFSGCTNLKNIVIPMNVSRVGTSAFSRCESLTSIIIPTSLIRIEAFTFYSCSSLVDITIPNGVLSIGKEAFCYCSNLTSVKIPNSVEYISDKAFYNCDNLKDVFYAGTENEWAHIDKSTYNWYLKDSKIHYGYEMGETVINLDSAFDGSPNKEFTISANVISKKVAPESSNVAWTLTPLDGQEGNISWGSMYSITSGENQYIISKPVTVSAVGKYKLTVSFNGVSATAEVVIDSSLKAKFPILRQNELKEYYTYYNGTEMKPGFTAEMDGENVSLDRLTYHYEDNDKPGMAKLVIDTLDGNAVNSSTEFLILPGKGELIKVKSENAGELEVEIEPIADWKKYQIALFDGDNLVDGYPKELVVEKTNTEGFFKKYIGMLQMEKDYIVKIRAVVDVNGELHGGAWIDSKAKTKGIVNITPESEIDTGFNNIYITLGSDNICFTGKGGIYFCDASTNKPVISMVPKATPVSGALIFDNGKISILQGNRIHLEINTNAKALNIDNNNVETRSGNSVLKADTEYYIQIDPGTIKYSHVDEESGIEVVHDGGFIGLSKGDASYKTIGYYAPTYKNPTGSEITLSYFSNLYGRNKASDIQRFDDSGSGWCYGFSAAFSSYYRGNPEIRAIVDQVPLFTDVDLWTCGNNNYSFEDYVKYGQAYLHSLLIAQQREKNKNKIDSLIQAVKSKQYPIIHFSSKKNGGHAVAAIEVIEELNDTTIIRVYDPSSNSQFCSHILKIKNDGSWEYGVYSNHTHDISYSFFTEECENDITKLDYIKKNNYLFAYINNIDIAKIRSNLFELSKFNNVSLSSNNGAYYWIEEDSFSIDSEAIASDENGVGIIKIYKGEDQSTTLSFSSSTKVDVDAQNNTITIVSTNGQQQNATLAYEYWEDNNKKIIEIDVASAGDIQVVKRENRLIVSGDEVDKELSVTAIDGKGDSRTIAVPITQNDISITADGKLIISEDTTKDGHFDTIIAEESFVTDIASDTISVGKIDNQTYTGKEIKPDILLKQDNDLVKDIDYTVSYSNNVNVGTATVTITGKGNYTGTKTVTFNITKANQSITAKTSASSIAIGKTATVSTTGNKGKVTYKSSNTAIATVNASTGVVTGKKAGTVTITATSAATSNYNAASKSVKITVTANKTLKKPGNCRFTKWNNSKYTGCRISWNKVDGAEGYQTLLSWTNGTHSSSTITKSNVLYRDCSVHPQHVSQMKVRAFYTSGGKRMYGPWSNVVYITPSPTKLTTKNASTGSNLKMNVSWNIVYGCNGYNVFVTTNPNGKWYWNQSTSEKASATSATITKCGGSKLKKNTRYYVRIVTRRKRNGVFCTVPMPASNTYIGSFVIK